jgi:hypothetical protein
MNFGYLAAEPSSFSVMDAAFDAGIVLFDTADVYGGPQSPDMAKGYGISEQTVGRWLRQSGHRDDIVLASKVYQPMGLGPNDRRLSAYHIKRACEASLRRLQTDHIDLYQMHHVDRATSPAGPLDAELRAFVAALLPKQWSPEQISHVLRAEFADQPWRHLAIETLYGAVYRPGDTGLERNSTNAVRTGRRRRRRHPRRCKAAICDPPSMIDQRLAEAEMGAASPAALGRHELDRV